MTAQGVGFNVLSVPFVTAVRTSETGAMNMNNAIKVPMSGQTYSSIISVGVSIVARFSMMRLLGE
jgi:hypothetical protein